MKKIRFILCLLCLICLVSLTSCNKVSNFNNQDYGKIKYYVAGLYIGVNKFDELSLTDPNPKIYFDFTEGSKFGKATTYAGASSSAAKFINLARDSKLDNGVNQYYLNVTMSFVNPDIDRVNLYLIYVDNNGNFSINEELTEKVYLSDSSSYNFTTKFTNNKQKYQVQIILFFK